LLGSSLDHLSPRRRGVEVERLITSVSAVDDGPQLAAGQARVEQELREPLAHHPLVRDGDRQVGGLGHAA
jgi:hypothetical protein